jgi:hypothetical protein
VVKRVSLGVLAAEACSANTAVAAANAAAARRGVNCAREPRFVIVGIVVVRLLRFGKSVCVRA